MPQFQLDTEGSVERHDGAQLHFYDDLDAFTQGYIEALFFTENAPGVTTEEWQATEDHDEGSIPGDVGFSDLAMQTLQRIIDDCAKFQKDNAESLALAYARNYDDTQAGRDFWLTRNGHGAGFWDRNELSEDGLGHALSTASRAYGECEVYLGDDGRVYA